MSPGQVNSIYAYSSSNIESEGPGAPSQKTSLLGGVVQILIFPRSSPRLADVGLFVRPKSQQSPLEQRVSLQAQLSSRSHVPSRSQIKCSIEITNLHCVGRRHVLCEAPTAVGHSSIPCERRHPIAMEHHSQISREPNISFTRAYCAFLHQWGGQAHCAFAPLGDLHR